MPLKFESWRTYSFEFFPTKTPEGVARKTVNVAATGAVTSPSSSRCTFGAGGSTRDPHAGHRAGNRRHVKATPAAPHLSCIGCQPAEPREILNRYQERRHPPHRRPARRPAVRHGLCRRAALRQRAGGVHPRRNRRPLPHRSRPPTRNTIPRRATHMTTSRNFMPSRSRPAARLVRSPSTSSTPTADFYFCRPKSTQAGRGYRQWYPASCRSIISASWRASPTPAAQKFHAGCA